MLRTTFQNLQLYFSFQKAEMEKQLSVEKEAHQATQQEKDTAAVALAKLQAQMALESEAHHSVTETAKLVSIFNTASSYIGRVTLVFAFYIYCFHYY